jgi:ABC-type enterobactin transport system permease subunit
MLLITAFSILGGAVTAIIFWDFGLLAILMAPVGGSVSGALAAGYLAWRHTRLRSRSLRGPLLS